MPHKLTEILLEHRASGILIGEINPEIAPQLAEDAYRIQNETIAAIGPVGAWKVQPMPKEGQPFASPILAKNIFVDGCALDAEDFPSLGIEAEVAVTINRALPMRSKDYSAAEIRDAIGSMHIALELLASRFIDRTKVPLLTGIADLQHSGGVVLGPAMPSGTLPEFSEQKIVLNIDGITVASTDGNATTENMLTALAWLANHAAARGLPLKSGDVVITGSRIGPLPLTGKQVSALADGLGAVSVTFI